MKRRPNNRGKNAEQETAKKEQPEAKEQILSGNQALSASDVDKLMVSISGLLALFAGVAGLTGHLIPSLWLFCFAICCGFVSLIAFLHERLRLAWWLLIHPWWFSSFLVVMTLVATGVAQHQLAKAELPDVLVPGDGPTPVLQPATERVFTKEALDPWPPELRQYFEDVARDSMADRVPENAVRVILGKCVSWAESFPYTLIAQVDEDLIVLHREESGIALSAKFFDSSGKIVCEIVKNKFFLNPGNYFRMEKTANRLVVFNDETKCVLDVEYINPLAIRISGEFYLRNGFPVVINDQVTKIGDQPLLQGMNYGSRRTKHPVAIWVDVPEDSWMSGGGGGYMVRTKEGYEAAIEKMRRDRPRIGVNRAKVTLMVTSAMPSCAIAIGNNGNGRAFVTGYEGVIFPETADKNIDQAMTEYLAEPVAKRETLQLVPGDFFMLDVFFLTPLTAEFIDDILEGRAKLYLFGRVKYLDYLEENHETRFCLLYHAETKAFRPYLLYNHAD